jgi:ABC-type tungstate transport system permease subunit
MKEYFNHVRSFVHSSFKDKKNTEERFKQIKEERARSLSRLEEQSVNLETEQLLAQNYLRNNQWRKASLPQYYVDMVHVKPRPKFTRQI